MAGHPETSEGKQDHFNSLHTEDAASPSALSLKAMAVVMRGGFQRVSPDCPQDVHAEPSWIP